jgi:hypothetical protein
MERSPVFRQTEARVPPPGIPNADRVPSSKAKKMCMPEKTAMSIEKTAPATGAAIAGADGSR